jgi:CRISPR-associated protein Csy2
MTALERRLGPESGIGFYGVGVICHRFEAQVTSGGYTRAFRLTRNPVGHDGSTAGIVEEGRAHLDVTLVFDVELDTAHRGETERQALAEKLSQMLAGMRIAGGSIMPPLPIDQRRRQGPLLELVPDLEKDQLKQYRRLSRRCLPGFALVSRADLLAIRLTELQCINNSATALDAWLDLSRWNRKAIEQPAQKEGGSPIITWKTESRPGWIVPIPVGFAALSKLHEPGTVARARDASTPFRFVESIWSTGQWISPHRLQGLSDLFWYTQHDQTAGLYQCRNDYIPRIPAGPAQN